MRTMYYFCLLVAAAGFHGLEVLAQFAYMPRPSGGPPGPPGHKGTTGEYGWTDDDDEGWVSCGCHDAPSCRKCGTQQHLCNGDCSWSYGGCYRKGPRPTRPPHPPTGETPVSMPSRPPPTWETPVSIPGSRPPPTYETPVHIGSSTPGPGGNDTSTEEDGTCNQGDACKGCGIIDKGYCCADNCNVNGVSISQAGPITLCKCTGSNIISAEDTKAPDTKTTKASEDTKAPDTKTTKASETGITQASFSEACNTGDACKGCGSTGSHSENGPSITYCCADDCNAHVAEWPLGGVCKCTGPPKPLQPFTFPPFNFGK